MPSLTSAQIRAAIHTSLIGRRVHHFEELASTNDWAARLAREGAAEGLVVLAEHQTGGRGRFDRLWISAPGEDLLFSVLLRPTILAPRLFLLTVAAAVAVAEALERRGLTVQVKWPNDVLVNGRKVCGILTESQLDRTRIEWAVVGIGLNVNSHPSEHADLAGRATSLLEELGAEQDRLELLCDVLESLDHHYVELNTASADELLAAWRGRLLYLGTRVRARSGIRNEIGTVEGVADDGSLLLRRDDGTLARIFSGEIHPVEG